MLTDEQLLQSQVVRGVLERMGNGGLHKTAGAVALGVDEVTLENAVLAICTKIAGQVLKEQRIASGLASLAKTAMTPGQQAALGVGVLGAGIGGANALSAAADTNPTGDMLDYVGPSLAGAVGGTVALPVGALAGSAIGVGAGHAISSLAPFAPKGMRHTLQSAPDMLGISGMLSGAVSAPQLAGRYIGEKTAANPFAAGADAVVKGMSPGRMGFAGKVTGAGANAHVNPTVKSSIPEYIQSYTPQHIPHNPNKAVEVAAASGAPKAKSKATVEGADVGELPSMFRLDSSAGQTTLAPSARKGGAGILREGGGVAAAQPMNFGRGQVGDQAAPMFNLQEMMARGGKTASILDRIFAA